MFGNFNIPGFGRAFFPNGGPSANNYPAHAHQPAFTGGGPVRDEFVPSFGHTGPHPGLAAHIVSQVGSRPPLSFKGEFHHSTWERLSNPPLENFPVVEGY